MAQLSQMTALRRAVYSNQAANAFAKLNDLNTVIEESNDQDTRLDGIEDGTTTLTKVVTGSAGIQAATPLTTTPVATVSITEYSTGKDITAVLTLTNFVIGALAGAAANLGIGSKVAAYPSGQHFELVYSFSSLSLKCAGTAVATDTGLGSVAASGAVALLSGTATFEDRITGQTITTGTSGGTAVSALTAATAGIGTGISLNTLGSVKNIFLNSAGAWNANNTDNLTASGTIVLKYTRMQ